MAIRFGSPTHARMTRIAKSLERTKLPIKQKQRQMNRQWRKATKRAK